MNAYLRFLYVQDKQGANDGDKGHGRQGSSQSGARRNAAALRNYIDRVTNTGQPKVMLVGYSMGGLIVRTYLADHRQHADEKVAGVVFVESALQGSILGLAAKALNAREARRVCAAQAGFPGGAVICFGLLSLIREELELTNEDAIAFRDLSPRSDIVRQNAEALVPSEPRYLTVPGDIRLRLPRNLLGEWAFGQPNEEVPVGDGVIPLGDARASETPPFGGASFKPSGFDARQAPLIRPCGIRNRDLQLLVDAFLVSRVADTQAKLACLRDAPEAHWNINARSGDTRPGRNTALPKLIADFLADTCRTAQLGDCRPSRFDQASARYVMRVGDDGRIIDIGGFRPRQYLADGTPGAGVDPTLGNAIEVFGTPARRGEEAGAPDCRIEWPDLALRATSADYRAGMVCGDSAGVQSFTVVGPRAKQWATDRGLQVGDTAGTLEELYPQARVDPAREHTYILVSEPSAIGPSGTLERLSASVYDGVVVAMTVSPYGAGE